MQRYSSALILLHWLMAATMIAAFLIGEVMEDLPRGPEKLGVLGWHALFGVSVAALLIPRLLLRAVGTPSLPATTPRWEVLAAKAVHLVLYGTMLLLPLTGLVSIFAGSRAIPVPGLFTLPSILPVEWLHEGMEEIHESVAKIFLVTLVLHIGATLWHAVIRRDGVASRMIPFLGR